MHTKTIILILLIATSCQKRTNQEQNTLFQSLDFNTTGIEFQNKLIETDSMNYFNYTSIYMGGGVSVGDINNDGLDDLFFTGNQVKNRLYLNQGNLKFIDITEASKIGGDNRWYTGSSMADVNGDGYLDIYCSVAGISKERRNQLYINNQDGTFSEMADAYGVADDANSTQATFLDYDNDGDLDLYLANYPIANVNTPNYIYRQRMLKADMSTSDKLFRNDGTTFTNVTEASGLLNYSFSLGATAGDLNNDGYQDIYVSSDYSVPDYIYLNNGDGTFKNVVHNATNHTAFYGMGVDIADINNDGYLDVFQADMDSPSNRRQKANMSSMNPQLFNEMVYMGFHYQYMHNCLQLNTGVFDNGIPQFSNISRLTGTSSTDWSWGPIFADFDNNGHKDLFITNGVRREINNTDFFNTYSKNDSTDLSDLEKSLKIPSEKTPNYMFKNEGDLNFNEVHKEWGITYEGFSNGVAYADLDNDGDLELIINNVDDYAKVYENTSANVNNYITLSFQGNKENKYGIGVRAYLKSKESTQMQELTLTRGFQSSVSPKLHFGLGKEEVVEEIHIHWPNGKVELLSDIAANQHLSIQHKNAKEQEAFEKVSTNIFSTSSNKTTPKIKHKENDYDDYQQQILLPHKMSALGPALAVADINNDGKDDFYLGGSHGNTAQLYTQHESGFKTLDNMPFAKDALSEDIGALFFDADADGDNDLYVVSGGYEFASGSRFYQDRLYINTGKGNFTKGTLPKMLSSGSRVYNADFNKDGKQDLLVLGRQIPEKYPLPASSYLLINNSTKGKVEFLDKTETMASAFKELGMATSAIIADIDNDTWDDIIIVGEWMPIKVFKNMQTHFKDVSSKMDLNKDSTGWWWSIKSGDFDNDGDLDFIVGNNGLNYKYQATADETFDIYVNDFDNNNKNDIVLSYYSDGKQVPVRGRSCSSQQIPSIKKKFKDYNSFSEASLIDVYTKSDLDSSLHYQVKSFASVYLENENGKFITHQLPIEAQFSSINQIIVEDFNKDQNLDILIGGNLYVSEVETPRNDAGFGYYLEGDGKGNFTPIPPKSSGLFIKGDVKDLKRITIGSTEYIIAAKNNDYLQFISLNKND